MRFFLNRYIAIKLHLFFSFDRFNAPNFGFVTLLLVLKQLLTLTLGFVAINCWFLTLDVYVLILSSGVLGEILFKRFMQISKNFKNPSFSSEASHSSNRGLKTVLKTIVL